jgi:hydrogenase expression/formation protein HypC
LTGEGRVRVEVLAIGFYPSPILSRKGRGIWIEENMCLAVPGKIITLIKDHSGDVDFGGVVRSVQFDLLPDVVLGDYVIVHAGFAISKLTETDALGTKINRSR